MGAKTFSIKTYADKSLEKELERLDNKFNKEYYRLKAKAEQLRLQSESVSEMAKKMKDQYLKDRELIKSKMKS